MDNLNPLTKHQKSVAIYGTTCDQVKNWVSFFQDVSSIPTGYLDACHHAIPIQAHVTFGESAHLWQTPGLGFSPWDFQWVNGNHFSGQKQVVVHNPEKLESLKKRKLQLTDVVLVIAEGGIPQHLIEWGVITADTIWIDPANKDSIAEWVKSQTQPAPLAALILTGGKSERMGQDKALLDYHGLPQWQFLLEQCSSLDIPAFVSVRNLEQAQNMGIKTDQAIEDRWLDMGPLGGILSAMKAHPKFSWMVMACDMPNWNHVAMRFLMQNRDSQKMATAFWNEQKQWAEPLATIWEKQSAPWMAMWMMQSQCARRMLATLSLKSIVAPEENWLNNINSPQEREEWIKSQDE